MQNFSPEILPFVKLWARDDLDYNIIESGDEFCIVYMSSCNLWAFILHNTILNIAVITNDLKDRNYHIIFAEQAISGWEKCSVEQFTIGKYITFNSYAYL